MARKRFKITYHLMPDSENIELVIVANDYEEACVFAKDYRKESFSVEEV